MMYLLNSHPSKLDEALSNVSLTTLQKSILTGRYLPLIKHLRERTARVSCMFHSSRIIITVGSLIVPALLSIQGTSIVNPQIYWGTWVVSLLVTICNALMALFKFDKRYYYLHTVLEKLISEGWQYIELTGKYSGYNIPGIIPTHDNQFIYFCHAVEKVRMKQVEEEYYKLSEPSTQQTGSQPVGAVPQDTKNSLIPPSPQHAELIGIPEEIIQAVKVQVANGVSQTIVEDVGSKKRETKDAKSESKKNGEVQTMPVYFNV